jgi:hypothetical protein
LAVCASARNRMIIMPISAINHVNLQLKHPYNTPQESEDYPKMK